VPEAAFRAALKLMDDLAGVRAAMAMLAEEGHGPVAAATAPPRTRSAPVSQTPSPNPSEEAPPQAGGAPSGAAGAASGGGGSAALYALMIAIAACAGGLWGRLQLVPVRWRSVAIVALNERPG
jgi:hypothetical protein